MDRVSVVRGAGRTSWAMLSRLGHRRSVRTRLTAGGAVLVMLLGPLRLAWAAAPPPQPGATKVEPGGDDRAILDRLPPVSADWLRPGGARSAAVLFDGDQGTSLR